MNEMLNKAKYAYENNDYKSTVDLCLSVLKSEKNKEANILLAKSYFYLSNVHSDKELNTIVSLIEIALNQSETIEEFFEIKFEIYSALEDWKTKSQRHDLDNVVKNPTLDNWEKYYKSLPRYAKLSMLLALSTGDHKKLLEFSAQTGLTVDELSEKYSFTLENKVNDEERKNLEFKAAIEIYNTTVSFIENNNDGSREFISKVAIKAINSFLVAKLALSHSMPKDENEDMQGNQELKLERLKAKAEMLVYQLNAIMCSAGQEHHLVFGQSRKKIYNELKETYNEIKHLNPQFEIPELPQEFGISLPTKQPANNTNSGGCYVATAVYGSYDCPQVWTLRRFRDFTLAETWYGRAFIRTYYAISPTFVRWFGNTEWFKNLWKPTLDRMVDKLNSNGVSDKPYNDYPW